MWLGVAGRQPRPLSSDAGEPREGQSQRAWLPAPDRRDKQALPRGRARPTRASRKTRIRCLSRLGPSRKQRFRLTHNSATQHAPTSAGDSSYFDHTRAPHPRATSR
eukprot:4993923-Prymnesium_polylepis.3